MSKKKKHRLRIVHPVSVRGRPVNGSIPPLPEDTITSIDVPISFGTSIDDVLGGITHNKVEIALKQFVEDYAGSIDVRPPYQRDDAWSLKQQSAFVQSVFNKGMAIPPMFLCAKNRRQDCANWWALDCRQRVTAILNFLANKFKITVYHKWGSGSVTQKQLLWKEIETDEKYSGIKIAFTSRKIELNVVDYLSLSDQRIIFEALNNGTPLNMDEITYCKHYLARKVLESLFPQVLGRISNHLVSSVRNQKRFAHIRMMHEVLILIGDQGWDAKVVVPRALRKQERLGSAKLVHRKLTEMKFEYESDITPDIRRALGLYGRLTPLADLANLMSEIFDEQTSLGREEQVEGSGHYSKYLNARQVIDPLGFLYGKIQAGATSIQELNLNKEALAKFLKDFYKAKAGIGVNQSTSDLKIMEKKFELMDKLFAKSKLHRSATA